MRKVSEGEWARERGEAGRGSKVPAFEGLTLGLIACTCGKMALSSEAPRGLSAVVTGGTGAIGRYLVAELLTSPAWERVVVVGRKEWTPPPDFPVDVAAAVASGRLQQQTIDMDGLLEDKHNDVFAGGFSASFCVLGTTHGDAGSNAAFRKVDLGMVSGAARASKAGGVPYFSHVTAAGTGGWFSSFTNYGRTKTAAEAAIKQLGFPTAVVFRPGMLDRGDMARSVERWAMKVLPAVRVQAVARAMRVDAEAALAGGAGGAGTEPIFRVVADKAIPRVA